MESRLVVSRSWEERSEVSLWGDGNFWKWTVHNIMNILDATELHT